MTDQFPSADFLCVSSVSKVSSSGLVQFNCDEYVNKLIKDLFVQRKEERFVDCVVVADSLRLPAHQSLLSSCSDYFDKKICCDKIHGCSLKKPLICINFTRDPWRPLSIMRTQWKLSFANVKSCICSTQLTFVASSACLFRTTGICATH